MTFSRDSKPFFKTCELVNLKKLAEERFIIYVGGCGYDDFDGRGQGGGHDFSAAGFFFGGGESGELRKISPKVREGRRRGGHKLTSFGLYVTL